jgi:hypothetical protein
VVSRLYLGAEGGRELHAAIEKSLAEGGLRYPGHMVDEELREALRLACATALKRRVLAEQLVIDVKQIWATIHSVGSNRTDERLSSIITACINEYYDGDERAAS